MSRSLRRSIMFFSLLAVLTLFGHDGVSAPIIFDAAFSPDGKTIGVATDSGFQLRAQLTKWVTYSYPVQGGVKFLKWALDSRRILLVSWQDQEIPTYSLLDIQQNRILFSFQEELRWFYFIQNTYSSTLGKRIYGVIEKTIPLSIELGHSNAIAFSPDSSELAYINKEGTIRVRSVENGALLREFHLDKYPPSSLGYTPDGKKLWVGIRFDTYSAATSDNTRLLYLDSQSGEILETKRLFYNYNKVSGNDTFWVLDVRSDQKYALAISSVDYVSTIFLPIIYLYVIDLESEDTVVTIAAANNDQVAILRAFYSNSGVSYGLSDNSVGWNVARYDEHNGLSGYQVDGRLKAYAPVPAHPFAPDGSRYLMIQENRLYIVDISDFENQKYEVVTLYGTAVKDFTQHETNSSTKEKHHDE